MAKRPARAPVAVPRQAVRTAKKGGTGPLWVSMLIVGLIAVSLPTVMVFSFGMLPSIVAWIVDRSEQKHSTFCVGGMNFCGVFPYLLKLWSGDHSIAHASEILTNVYSLVLIFGSAGFGWLLFISIPPVVAAFLNVIAQHRIALLRATQRRIIEEWGESVAKPLEGATAAKPKQKAGAAGQARRAR